MKHVFMLSRVFSNGEQMTYSAHVDAVGAMAEAEEIDAIRFVGDNAPRGVKRWASLGTLSFAGFNATGDTVWRVTGFEVKE